MVLSWIKGLKLPFLKKPIQEIIPREPKWSSTEKSSIKLCLKRLLNMGAITMVKPCKNQYIANIFLRKKRDGSERVILNLKSLNKFIRTAHFKMEDQKLVSKLLFKDCFLSTLDLKDAYLMLAVHQGHRKYLRFRFEGKIYEYNSMPFGLNCAPLVFTKLMKPVLSHLRKRGFMSVLYLDDFLLIGSSYSKCSGNVSVTVKLLESLGYIINYDKSSLTPSRDVSYLGMHYNSQDMTVSPTTEKRLHMLAITNKFSKKKHCKIRDFAHFLGNIVACCPAIKYAWAYTKRFERAKYLALKTAADNYDSKMEIDVSLKPIRNATAQTISRWIKTMLEKSGVDTNRYTAHSTRHASASAAARKGFSYDTIRTATGWTQKSQVFANFYQRPLASKEIFANAILDNTK
nr:unnamed protein product [Callosobruchus chinensis]